MEVMSDAEDATFYRRGPVRLVAFLISFYWFGGCLLVVC